MKLSEARCLMSENGAQITIIDKSTVEPGTECHLEIAGPGRRDLLSAARSDGPRAMSIAAAYRIARQLSPTCKICVVDGGAQ